MVLLVRFLYQNLKLAAGGKPSTRFPPGGLVELPTLPALSVLFFAFYDFCCLRFLISLRPRYHVLSPRAACPTPVVRRPGLSRARPIFADRREGSSIFAVFCAHRPKARPVLFRPPKCSVRNRVKTVDASSARVSRKKYPVSDDQYQF